VGIADYLRGAVAVRELGGGVSNTVRLAEFSDGRRIVLKQALPKLRVEQDWFADRGRIFRESSVLRQLAQHLPPGSLPAVLFEDRDDFAFGMTACAGEPWKTQLMRGEVRPDVASKIGELLGAMWRFPNATQFADQTVFDQLRLDPYYRATARVHPDLAQAFDRLLQPRPIALVHGDWSPKNFLVDSDSVVAIDWEVVHFGDPAFDIAFLSNHLALKSFLGVRCWPAAERFLSALPAGWPEDRTIAHLGALMLARIDGKSPVEYLGDDQRRRVRAFGRELILHPPATVREVFERI
jgi:5-methylthioribose kinase